MPNDKHAEQQEARALWQHFCRADAASDGDGHPIDVGLLAAWLDGRLREDEANAVDAILVSSKDWQEILFAASRGEVDGNLPPAILAAARATPRQRVDNVQLLAAWLSNVLRRPRALAAASAATAAIALAVAGSIGGFALGQQAYDEYARLNASDAYALAAFDLSEDATLLLDDPLINGEDELLVLEGLL